MKVSSHVLLHNLSCKLTKLLVTGAVCESGASSPCFVINGVATLTLSESADANQVITTARDAIQQSITNGVLRSADPRVTNISTRNTAIPNPPISPTSGGGSGVPLYGWILIGVGSGLVVIIGLCCIFFKRAPQEDFDGVGQDFDNQDYPNGQGFYFDNQGQRIDVPGQASAGQLPPGGYYPPPPGGLPGQQPPDRSPDYNRDWYGQPSNMPPEQYQGDYQGSDDLPPEHEDGSMREGDMDPSHYEGDGNNALTPVYEGEAGATPEDSEELEPEHEHHFNPNEVNFDRAFGEQHR